MTKASVIIEAVFIGMVLAFILWMTAYRSMQLETSRVTCYEDQACWDCSSMGNKVCGVRP